MNKIYINFVIIFSAILVNTSSACELTDEYKRAMAEVRKWARYEHQQCTKSVGTFYYWQEVSKCKKEGRGKNVAGGCQHVAGYRQSERPKDAGRHCEILRVNDVDRKSMLEQYVEEKNIIMCISGEKTE